MGNFDDFLKRNNLTLKVPTAPTSPTQNQIADSPKPTGGFDRFLKRNGLTAKPTANINHIPPSDADTPGILKSVLNPVQPTLPKQPQFRQPVGLIHPLDRISDPVAKQKILDTEALVQQATAMGNQKRLQPLQTEFYQPMQKLQDTLSQHGKHGSSGFATAGDYQSFMNEIDQLRRLADGRKNQYSGDAEMLKEFDKIYKQLNDLSKTAQYHRSKMTASQKVNDGNLAYLQAQEDAAAGKDTTQSMWTFYTSLPYRQGFQEGSAYQQSGEIPHFIADGEAWDKLDGNQHYTLSKALSECSTDKLVYESVNGNWAATVELGKRDLYRDPYTSGLPISMGNSQGMDLTKLSPEETKVFNYLYGKYGWNEAKAFLNTLAGDLSARRLADFQQARAAEAKAQPVLRSIQNIIESPYRSLINTAPVLADALDGKLETGSAHMYDIYKQNAVISAVADGIDSEFGKGAYLFGMSLADNAARAAASLGNPFVASAMAGSKAFASGMALANSKGIDGWKATALAGIGAAAEIGAEFIQFDKLFNNPDFSKATIIEYLMGNATTEALEEMTTEGINTLADIIISQDKSEWQKAVQAYKSEGKSDAAAWVLAIKDQGAAILEAGKQGFLSGLFMSGGTAGISYLSGNLPDAPASMPKVQEAVQAEYTKRIEAAKENGNPLSTEDQTSIYQSVVADLAAGKLEGYEMTGEEMAKVHNDYQQYLALHQDVVNNIPTVPHTNSSHPSAGNVPAQTPSTAPAETNVLSSAISTLHQGGTVSNSMAERILSDQQAVETLVQKTGMTLPETQSARRAAVKAAVTQLSQQPNVDTTTQTGYDNQNTTGGPPYGTEQDRQEANIYRTAEAGAFGIRGEAQAEAGNRPGVSGQMGENRSAFSENSSDWGQRGELTVSPEPYAPEDYVQSEGGSSLQQTQSGLSEQQSSPHGVRYYVSKVNQAILQLVNRVKSGTFTVNEKVDLGTVTDEVAARIHKLTGIDVSGYRIAIEARQIDHILKNHGENGKSNRSMADPEDIARIEYALTAPDSISNAGTTTAYVTNKNGKMKPADTVLYEKMLEDGSYYVVQAVPETKKRTLYVVTAFIGKSGYKKGATQSTNANSPGATPEAEFASTPINSIHPDGAKVNPTTSVGAAQSNFSGKAAYNDLLYEGNVQPDRPGDVRPMEVPKTDAYGRHVSEFAANAYGAEVTPDHAADQIQELIAIGALGFDTKTNRQMLEDASAAIKEKGLAASEKAVTKAAFSGKATDSDIAKAMLLYATYANKKSQSAQDKAAELMVDLSTMANDAGRRLQLFSLLRKMTPEGQLMAVQKGVQRAVDKINGKRSQKNQAEVTIPQELMDDYLDAAQLDLENPSEESAKEKEDAERAIYKAAAAQIKASPMEKLNAWRYMAMLGNVKTQARNFAGNAAFRPLVNTKRIVGAILESAFVEQDKRTKAILGVGKESRDLIQWAKDDAKTQTAKDMLSYCAQTGDAARTQIDENRQIYDTQWLENVRKLVQAVPEAADRFFKRREYSVSLASFLKARGFTAADLSSGSVSDDVLTEARNYAAQEALKATFNDHNSFSDLVANLRYKGDNSFGKAVNILAEGVLPFRRTPANILVRGLEYSPLHLLKSVTYDIAKVRSGEMTGAQYIDGIASGFTGTAAMALGYALCAGIFVIRLRGKIDDEEEKRQGHQSYALEIGDKSYTIDWLAPTNIPLFVGANLYESLHGEVDTGWFGSAVDAVGGAFDPMLELSCLSSLNDLLESTKYVGDGEPIWTVAATAATSYLNQFIPTLFGQIEQATEGSKNSVYSNADTAVERFAQKTVGRFTQRIPGVDLYQAQKYDAWGRPVETSSWGEALISPSYASDISDDPVDKEISRLNKAQDKNVSPSLPSKTLTVEGEEIRLSANQYETLCRTQGENQRRLVEGIMSLETYGKLTDDEKAAVISTAYNYARELSKSSVDVDGRIPAYIRDRPQGMSEAEAIIRHVVTDGKGEKHADLPVDVAAIIAETIGNIPKETKPDGTTAPSVRPIQKMEAVVANDELDPYVEKILPAYMEQSQQKKYKEALDKGYDSDEFVAGYRLYLDQDQELSKPRQIQQMADELGMHFRAAKILWDIYAQRIEKEKS